MRDSAATNGLTMSWRPVVDERGRTHMEAHWTLTSTPQQQAATPSVQAAHAA